jgi:hypothetical protein
MLIFKLRWRGYKNYPSISTKEEACNRDPALVTSRDGIRGK